MSAAFRFVVFWGVAAIGVAWEWQRLVGGERLGLRVAVCVLGVCSRRRPGRSTRTPRLSLLMLHRRRGGGGRRGRPGPPHTAPGAGALYAGAAMLAPALLRGSPTQGLAAILWLFAIVWGTDIGAYFGGRLLGGPKLWPSISPGKTWSGALIGAARFDALLAWIVAAIATPGGVKVVAALGLGLVTSALSQVGDLFESAMKRRAGVKDSSRLIPGHGGLMDRLDGFIVAAAFAAAVAWTRSEGPWIAPGLLKW